MKFLLHGTRRLPPVTSVLVAVRLSKLLTLYLRRLSHLMSVKEKAPGYQPGVSSYQCYVIHLGIPPRTPQGTRPLTRISGFTRTHPRRRAGKAGDLLSFTERIFREPPVNGLSRHILAKAPVFHAPVDSGSAPVMRKKKAPV